MLDSIRLLRNGAQVFAERCISGLEADRERSLQNLMGSSAMATAFVPALGYEKTARLVKQSQAEKRPFIELALAHRLLSETDVRTTLYRSIGIPDDASGTDVLHTPKPM